MRIRVRSLLAADGACGASAASVAHPVTARIIAWTTPSDMQKKGYTILAPQMSPIHFHVLEPIFRNHGYNFEVLQNDDRAAIDAGLKYVNNDACYPVDHGGRPADGGRDLRPVRHRPPCPHHDADGRLLPREQLHRLHPPRAGKGGLGHIPVISLNANGMETNEGFRISPSLLMDAAHAIVLGDLLMRCLYRVRPYELEKGSANALHHKWRDICIDSLTSEHPKYRYATALPRHCRGLRRAAHRRNDPQAARRRSSAKFSSNTCRLPTTMWSTFWKREGAEAVVPDLLDFFAALLHLRAGLQAHAPRQGVDGSASAKLGVPALQRMRRPAIEALKQSSALIPPWPLSMLRSLPSPFLSIGNQYGEGWFLAGEMAELITSGTPNIVCIQPFACLPNHVVGKGVIKALRESYPRAKHCRGGL